MRSFRKIKQFFVDIPIKEGAILNNRYEVLRVMGTGSYGIVYLVKDLKTKTNRVVKQLRQSKRRNKTEIDLFKNELSLLRKLDHQNMPFLYEAFSTNGNYFYVMSLVEGDNLEDLIFLHNKKFNEEESLLILEQLLGLVNYLHKNNIFHLDLRIPNMLLKNKELYLIDFGLAKQVSSESSHILEMKQQDYYDLGDILLYLLYTTYSSNNKKALPWTEELSLEKETAHLLKRLLRINEPYSDVEEILIDLQAALNVAIDDG
ncbi:protein kinase domain-containing protein [Virgibacillus doumboii]|uniref:protein kinase domain-containing protein n=1 Tax=Virgibacillus doumboii TaxID=2697503 RepID=UPI001FE96149|nr:protein kinase [Virgibacillus doumboii]